MRSNHESKLARDEAMRQMRLQQIREKDAKRAEDIRQVAEEMASENHWKSDDFSGLLRILEEYSLAEVFPALVAARNEVWAFIMLDYAMNLMRKAKGAE